MNCDCDNEMDASAFQQIAAIEFGSAESFPQTATPLDYVPRNGFLFLLAEPAR